MLPNSGPALRAMILWWTARADFTPCFGCWSRPADVRGARGGLCRTCLEESLSRIRQAQGHPAAESSAAPAGSDKCSFCRRRNGARQLVRWLGGSVCGECVELAREIVAGH
jgi:hypothetical protein